MKRKRLLLSAAVLLIVHINGWTQVGIRNISSAQIDTYFDGTVAVEINQVLLFPVVDWLSGEVKVQRQDSPVLGETTISVAPIFLPGNGIYIIARYGLGIGAGAENTDAGSRERNISHDATVDFNYETATLYLNAAIRGSLYPADDYWFVLPTVAGRIRVTENVGVLGRYFFSYNSLAATSHALLTEVDVDLSARVRVTGGLSGGLTLSDGELQWETTGLGGIDFRIQPQLVLSYQVEYLGRIGRADGLRNVLVLDASF
jgi:hypothetical protein